MTDKDEAIVIEEKSKTHAGLSLKHARENKKLSITQVASELRLTRKAIEHLEQQQWELLHGRAYARGYYLNYVRFLGLNEAEMLAAFDDEYAVVETEQKLSHSVPESKGFPWAGISFAILAILIMWFAYQQWQATKSAEQPSGQTPDWIEDQPEPELPIDELEGFDASVVEPLEPDTAETEQKVQTVVENLSDEIEKEHTVDNLAELNTEPAIEQEQLESLETNLADSEQLDSNEDQAELVLSAGKDCWVEVTDAEQQILYYDLIKADSSVTIVGKAPVNILLGNASDIKVTINGNQFDTSSFIDGDVARFTVGVES